jgi:hypothetical protein
MHADRRLGAVTSFLDSVIDWTQISLFWVRRSAYGGVFVPGNRSTMASGVHSTGLVVMPVFLLAHQE